MIQFIYQNQYMTLEEIYNHYPDPSDPDTFATWFMSSLEQNIIQYENPDRISKEQFLVQRQSERKRKIREMVSDAYVNSCLPANKKKKKSLRKAYKKTEQYVIDCEHAYQSDPILHSLSNENVISKLYSDFVENSKMNERKIIKHQLSNFIDRKREEVLQNMLSESIFYQYEKVLLLSIIKQIEECLRTEKDITNYCLGMSDHYAINRLLRESTETEIIGYFIDCFMDDPEDLISNLLYGESFLDGYLIDFFFQEIPFLRSLNNKEDWRESFSEIFDHELSDFKMDLIDAMPISELYILENLMKNPHYKDDANRFYEEKRKEADASYFSAEELAVIKREEEQRRQNIERSLLSSMPEEYKDYYPLARQMKRKFVLHIGPTNSGKTYQAVKSLCKGGSGIYLAPLRLLAFEQFEIMNKENYPCNLITGEEKTLIQGAAFQSSTIEMADLTAHYHYAVIDEAQMIADKNRGGAWTAAILGLCAEEIHVCAAPYAEVVLIRLIRECGDEYEIIRHNRDTILEVEKAVFHFPEDVREHDALIVFSKKNVHAVAAELQRKGKKCSIIYGNLPYDVRQEEARKFLTGETQIVVATDAIGMGMNLPVQRVIFLETAKFDGIVKRRLNPAEIQQIAGRAGRKGLYSVGLVNCEEYKFFIQNAINQEVAPITVAVLQFPDSLLGIDASLSEILEQWNRMNPKSGYRKAIIKEQVILCKELEKYTDNKRLVYDFITIPFDSTNVNLKNIWRILFDDELNHRPCNYQRFLPQICDDLHDQYLNKLEEDYKVCDLLGFYMERFHPREACEEIKRLKRRISEQIIKILDKQKLTGKKCRYCGNAMPWNHPYGICEACYWGTRYY